MSGLFGTGSAGGPGRTPGDEGPGLRELRLGIRTTELGVGTLACPICDAPVQPATYPAAATTQLSCSWCGHSGPLQRFLTLASPSTPSRPTRVVIRVTVPERGPGRRITIEPRSERD